MIYADATDDLNSVIDGAGPIAGVFFLFLGIAVFIIWKSMNKQLKKIDKNLPPGRADLRRQADERYTEEAEERGAEEAEHTAESGAGESNKTEEQKPADG